MSLDVKRVYEPAAAGDGFRVLVDRLWPRGVSKERAQIGLWLKDVAPSNALRQWFGHVPEKWQEFQRRYFAELDQNQAPVDQLRALARKQHVTLVYSARDEAHNQAVALRTYLEQQPRP